jgi:hypothetical protein
MHVNDLETIYIYNDLYIYSLTLLFMAIYSKCNYFEGSVLHNKLNTYDLVPYIVHTLRVSVYLATCIYYTWPTVFIKYILIKKMIIFYLYMAACINTRGQPFLIK